MMSNITLKKWSLMAAAACMIAGGGSHAVAGNGTGDGNGGDHQTTTLTPYRVVAEIEPILHTSGEVDYEATYAKSKAIAAGLASWIQTTDETVVLGKEYDYQVIGDVLEVPSTQPINPYDKDSDNKTVSLIEVYQDNYYGRALGTLPIVNEELMEIGEIHAPALPFSIAVSFEEDDMIRIITTDCLSYFKLFWTDVITGEQIEDQTFEEAVSTMFLDMKNDLSNITWNALEALHYHYVQYRDKNVGPSWDTAGDVISDITQLENQSPYLHYTYTKLDGTSFSAEEVKALATAVNNTLADNDDLGLSASWNAVRPAPIYLPDDNYVIEAGSPEYDRLVLSDTRLDHANALTNEIAVVAINDGRELLVSYLDPNFMLAMMYEFSPEEEALIVENQVGNSMVSDLQAIIDDAMQHSINIAVSEPTQVFYDMIRLDE